jgi:hypothetical protein
VAKFKYWLELELELIRGVNDGRKLRCPERPRRSWELDGGRWRRLETELTDGGRERGYRIYLYVIN